jgi:hypothetical protein
MNSMPRAGWVLLVCATLIAAGCERLLTHPDLDRSPTVVRSLAPFASTDGLVVESILLERPAGDAFLDGDLWNHVLLAGSPERRALLFENGLRAGLLSGNIPTAFQTLIESEADVVDSQARTFNVRKEAVVPTAGPIDPCVFTVLTDLAGQPRPVALQQARAGVFIKPESHGDGRVRIYCEPQIQHGVRREWYRPTEDGTQLAKFDEVPLERYPACGFHVTLGADDYLVIGWVAERPATLGAVLFGVEAQQQPRQRLLVLRARPMVSITPADLKPLSGPATGPSVAAQAASRKFATPISSTPDR